MAEKPINPLWLEPFKIGFTRHVTHYTSASGKRAYVKYVTPNGKILNRQEKVVKYLSENPIDGITPECFVFRSLTIYHEPQETHLEKEETAIEDRGFPKGTVELKKSTDTRHEKIVESGKKVVTKERSVSGNMKPLLYRSESPVYDGSEKVHSSPSPHSSEYPVVIKSPINKKQRRKSRSISQGDMDTFLLKIKDESNLEDYVENCTTSLEYTELQEKSHVEVKEEKSVPLVVDQSISDSVKIPLKTKRKIKRSFPAIIDNNELVNLDTSYTLVHEDNKDTNNDITVNYKGQSEARTLNRNKNIHLKNARVKKVVKKVGRPRKNYQSVLNTHVSNNNNVNAEKSMLTEKFIKVKPKEKKGNRNVLKKAARKLPGSKKVKIKQFLNKVKNDQVGSGKHKQPKSREFVDTDSDTSVTSSLKNPHIILKLVKKKPILETPVYSDQSFEDIAQTRPAPFISPSRLSSHSIDLLAPTPSEIDYDGLNILTDSQSEIKYNTPVGPRVVTKVRSESDSTNFLVPGRNIETRYTSPECGESIYSYFDMDTSPQTQSESDFKENDTEETSDQTFSPPQFLKQIQLNENKVIVLPKTITHIKGILGCLNRKTGIDFLPSILLTKCDTVLESLTFEESPGKILSRQSSTGKNEVTAAKKDVIAGTLLAKFLEPLRPAIENNVVAVVTGNEPAEPSFCNIYKTDNSTPEEQAATCSNIEECNLKTTNKKSDAELYDGLGKGKGLKTDRVHVDSLGKSHRHTKAHIRSNRNVAQTGQNLDCPDLFEENFEPDYVYESESCSSSKSSLESEVSREYPEDAVNTCVNDAAVDKNTTFKNPNENIDFHINREVDKSYLLEKFFGSTSENTDTIISNTDVQLTDCSDKILNNEKSSEMVKLDIKSGENSLCNKVTNGVVQRTDSSVIFNYADTSRKGFISKTSEQDSATKENNEGKHNIKEHDTDLAQNKQVYKKDATPSAKSSKSHVIKVTKEHANAESRHTKKRGNTSKSLVVTKKDIDKDGYLTIQTPAGEKKMKVKNVKGQFKAGVKGRSNPKVVCEVKQNTEPEIHMDTVPGKRNKEHVDKSEEERSNITLVDVDTKRSGVDKVIEPAVPNITDISTICERQKTNLSVKDGSILAQQKCGSDKVLQEQSLKKGNKKLKTQNDSQRKSAKYSEGCKEKEVGSDSKDKNECSKRRMRLLPHIEEALTKVKESSLFSEAMKKNSCLQKKKSSSKGNKYGNKQNQSTENRGNNKDVEKEMKKNGAKEHVKNLETCNESSKGIGLEKSKLVVQNETIQLLKKTGMNENIEDHSQSVSNKMKNIGISKYDQKVPGGANDKESDQINEHETVRCDTQSSKIKTISVTNDKLKSESSKEKHCVQNESIEVNKSAINNDVAHHGEAVRKKTKKESLASDDQIEPGETKSKDSLQNKTTKSKKSALNKDITGPSVSVTNVQINSIEAKNNDSFQNEIIGLNSGALNNDVHHSELVSKKIEKVFVTDEDKIKSGISKHKEHISGSSLAYKKNNLSENEIKTSVACNENTNEDSKSQGNEQVNNKTLEINQASNVSFVEENELQTNAKTEIQNILSSNVACDSYVESSKLPVNKVGKISRMKRTCISSDDESDEKTIQRSKCRKRKLKVKGREQSTAYLSKENSKLVKNDQKDKYKKPLESQPKNSSSVILNTENERVVLDLIESGKKTKKSPGFLFCRDDIDPSEIRPESPVKGKLIKGPTLYYVESPSSDESEKPEVLDETDLESEVVVDFSALKALKVTMSDKAREVKKHADIQELNIRKTISGKKSSDAQVEHLSNFMWKFRHKIKVRKCEESKPPLVKLDIGLFDAAVSSVMAGAATEEKPLSLSQIKTELGGRSPKVATVQPCVDTSNSTRTSKQQSLTINDLRESLNEIVNVDTLSKPSQAIKPAGNDSLSENSITNEVILASCGSDKKDQNLKAVEQIIPLLPGESIPNKVTSVINGCGGTKCVGKSKVSSTPVRLKRPGPSIKKPVTNQTKVISSPGFSKEPPQIQRVIQSSEVEPSNSISHTTKDKQHTNTSSVYVETDHSQNSGKSFEAPVASDKESKKTPPVRTISMKGLDGTTRQYKIKQMRKVEMNNAKTLGEPSSVVPVTQVNSEKNGADTMKRTECYRKPQEISADQNIDESSEPLSITSRQLPKVKEIAYTGQNPCKNKVQDITVQKKSGQDKEQDTADTVLTGNSEKKSTQNIQEKEAEDESNRTTRAGINSKKKAATLTIKVDMKTNNAASKVSTAILDSEQIEKLSSPELGELMDTSNESSVKDTSAECQMKEIVTESSRIAPKPLAKRKSSDKLDTGATKRRSVKERLGTRENISDSRKQEVKDNAVPKRVPTNQQEELKIKLSDAVDSKNFNHLGMLFLEFVFKPTVMKDCQYLEDFEDGFFRSHSLASSYLIFLNSLEQCLQDEKGTNICDIPVVKNPLALLSLKVLFRALKACLWSDTYKILYILKEKMIETGDAVTNTLTTSQKTCLALALHIENGDIDKAVSLLELTEVNWLTVRAGSVNEEKERKGRTLSLKNLLITILNYVERSNRYGDTSSVILGQKMAAAITVFKKLLDSREDDEKMVPDYKTIVDLDLLYNRMVKQSLDLKQTRMVLQLYELQFVIDQISLKRYYIRKIIFHLERCYQAQQDVLKDAVKIAKHAILSGLYPEQSEIKLTGNKMRLWTCLTQWEIYLNVFAYMTRMCIAFDRMSREGRNVSQHACTLTIILEDKSSDTAFLNNEYSFPPNMKWDCLAARYRLGNCMQEHFNPPLQIQVASKNSCYLERDQAIRALSWIWNSFLGKQSDPPWYRSSGLLSELVAGSGKSSLNDSPVRAGISAFVEQLVGSIRAESNKKSVHTSGASSLVNSPNQFSISISPTALDTDYSLKFTSTPYEFFSQSSSFNRSKEDNAKSKYASGHSTDGEIQSTSEYGLPVYSDQEECQRRNSSSNEVQQQTSESYDSFDLSKPPPPLSFNTLQTQNNYKVNTRNLHSNMENELSFTKSEEYCYDRSQTKSRKHHSGSSYASAEKLPFENQDYYPSQVEEKMYQNNISATKDRTFQPYSKQRNQNQSHISQKDHSEIANNPYNSRQRPGSYMNSDKRSQTYSGKYHNEHAPVNWGKTLQKPDTQELHHSFYPIGDFQAPQPINMYASSQHVNPQETPQENIVQKSTKNKKIPSLLDLPTASTHFQANKNNAEVTTSKMSQTEIVKKQSLMQNIQESVAQRLSVLIQLERVRSHPNLRELEKQLTKEFFSTHVEQEFTINPNIKFTDELFDELIVFIDGKYAKPKTEEELRSKNI